MPVRGTVNTFWKSGAVIATAVEPHKSNLPGKPENDAEVTNSLTGHAAKHVPSDYGEQKSQGRLAVEDSFML